ncbi:MAG TPA: hypothetical protein VEQ35_09330 [Beijerinckia sp.]|nr:hypothetical protein [Beijerinckia sp.]
MNWLDRFLAGLLFGLAFLFITAAVHIISVLAMRDIIDKDVFDRLSSVAHPVHLTLLPPPQPGHEFIPFEDPALVQGVCLYDLSHGPLRLHADVEAGQLLTLSFRTRSAQVFYAITDSAAQHGKIDAVILTPTQLEDVEADDDDDDETPQDLRVVAPESKGFVLISALAGFPSERPEAEARIKSVTCDIAQQ